MLTRNDYIALYSADAVRANEGTGLFPSVAIAQAIVESGNGNSVLASKYKNHFGIKADSSWTGRSVNLSTREVISGSSVNIQDNFRVYDTVEDSYRDRVRFLQENPRYRNAGVFDANTPLQQLESLQRAGYATDPNYANTLNAVLERENLSMFDKAVSYTVAYTKKNTGLVITIVILFLILIYLLYKRAN